MYKQVSQCRICGNPSLVKVLDLGHQVLTGVFPNDRTMAITRGPLWLLKCHGSGEVCGLLQLGHSYELSEMYGDNYGYRSGLNASMVAHLHAKVKRIRGRVELRAGDLVVDIGSNDSTTLQAYPADLTLVGIDPTGTKFRSYYPPHVQLIPDFFSARLVADRFPGQKASVVTSFSMFYDLEDPPGFMRQVHEVLADDGIWVFEQSYMPTMLAMNSYDTACHEHLEYYALAQIEWMCRRVGFRIVDVEFNDINGGSFSVTAAKTSSRAEPHARVCEAFDAERALGLHTLEPYRAFAQRVADCKRELQSFVREARAQGKTVAALGASTKGNVLLQYCEFTAADISMVGEVNAEKFGAYTPGTEIPIVPESKLLARNPDYLLVLPWHFRRFFLQADKFKGRQLVFPLPRVEVVCP
jgi:C-methyltransferase C-terminal domain/Putative zinc binding domain/Methyltransferase domain